jgi:LEA14-like dessication related protein
MKKGNNMKTKILIPLWIAVMCLLTIRCAELQKMLQIQKPVLNVAGVRITKLTLDNIDLAFDVDIQNPNPVSVNLAGLDYDFQLNNASFIRGNQNKGLSVQSNAKSRIEIPVSLGFQELYKTYQALKNNDSTNYTLAGGMTFDLPVLGQTRIPIQKSGHLPLVKIPSISVRSLKMNRMNISGADLTLELKMDNPNAFALLLKNLNYNFNINGQSWARGNLSSPVSVNSKGNGAIRIPMTLDFTKMGATMIQLLSGSSALEYNLTGGLGLDSSLPLLKNINLPINNTGSVKITR